MEKLGTEALIGILVAVVGVSTVLGRVVEKLVAHFLEESKEKRLLASSKKDSFPPKHTGNTTDLAVQREAIRALAEDTSSALDKVIIKLSEMDGVVSKEIPISVAKTQNQISNVQEDVRDLKSALDNLRTSIDGNTAATRSLIELFSQVSRRDR